MQDSLKPLTVITLKESPGNAILVGSISPGRVLRPAFRPLARRLNRRRAAGVVRKRDTGAAAGRRRRQL